MRPRLSWDANTNAWVTYNPTGHVDPRPVPREQEWQEAVRKQSGERGGWAGGSAAAAASARDGSWQGTTSTRGPGGSGGYPWHGAAAADRETSGAAWQGGGERENGKAWWRSGFKWKAVPKQETTDYIRTKAKGAGDHTQQSQEGPTPYQDVAPPPATPWPDSSCAAFGPYPPSSRFSAHVEVDSSSWGERTAAHGSYPSFSRMSTECNSGAAGAPDSVLWATCTPYDGSCSQRYADYAFRTDEMRKRPSPSEHKDAEYRRDDLSPEFDVGGGSLSSSPPWVEQQQIADADSKENEVADPFSDDFYNDAFVPPWTNEGCLNSLLNALQPAASMKKAPKHDAFKPKENPFAGQLTWSEGVPPSRSSRGSRSSPPEEVPAPSEDSPSPEQSVAEMKTESPQNDVSDVKSGMADERETIYSSELLCRQSDLFHCRFPMWRNLVENLEDVAHPLPLWVAREETAVYHLVQPQPVFSQKYRERPRLNGSRLNGSDRRRRRRERQAQPARRPATIVMLIVDKLRRSENCQNDRDSKIAEMGGKWSSGAPAEKSQHFATTSSSSATTLRMRFGVLNEAFIPFTKSNKPDKLPALKMKILLEEEICQGAANGMMEEFFFQKNILKEKGIDVTKYFEESWELRARNFVWPLELENVLKRTLEEWLMQPRNFRTPAAGAAPGFTNEVRTREVVGEEKGIADNSWYGFWHEEEVVLGSEEGAREETGGEQEVEEGDVEKEAFSIPPSSMGAADREDEEAAKREEAADREEAAKRQEDVLRAHEPNYRESSCPTAMACDDMDDDDGVPVFVNPALPKPTVLDLPSRPKGGPERLASAAPDQVLSQEAPAPDRPPPPPEPQLAWHQAAEFPSSIMGGRWRPMHVVKRKYEEGFLRQRPSGAGGGTFFEPTAVVAKFEEAVTLTAGRLLDSGVMQPLPIFSTLPGGVVKSAADSKPAIDFEPSVPELNIFDLVVDTLVASEGCKIALDNVLSGFGSATTTGKMSRTAIGKKPVGAPSTPRFAVLHRKHAARELIWQEEKEEEPQLPPVLIFRGSHFCVKAALKVQRELLRKNGSRGFARMGTSPRVVRSELWPEALRRSVEYYIISELPYRRIRKAARSEFRKADWLAFWKGEDGGNEVGAGDRAIPPLAEPGSGSRSVEKEAEEERQ